MNALTAIEERRSVRSYQAKQVEQNKLDSVIKAGNCAPIFGDIKISVIENPSFLDEINNTTLNMMKNSGNDFMVQRASINGYNPLYGAPVLILISSPQGNDNNAINMANAACAAENMIIAATSLKLGTCFVLSAVMAFSNPDLLAKVCIPEGYVPICGVLIGYADDNAPAHERSKKENVNYIR